VEIWISSRDLGVKAAPPVLLMPSTMRWPSGASWSRPTVRADEGNLDRLSHAAGFPYPAALDDAMAVWGELVKTNDPKGAAAGRTPRSSHPAMSAFPGRVTGSACTSSFSRLARRSLALRPAHSRGHQFVTRYPKASDIPSPPCLLRLLPAGANRRVGLAPTGKRRLVTAHPHCSHPRISLNTSPATGGCARRFRPRRRQLGGYALALRRQNRRSCATISSGL
jgi:hypothetical protein